VKRVGGIYACRRGITAPPLEHDFASLPSIICDQSDILWKELCYFALFEYVGKRDVCPVHSYILKSEANQTERKVFNQKSTTNPFVHS
jgi:hypothetical protein